MAATDSASAILASAASAAAVQTPQASPEPSAQSDDPANTGSAAAGDTSGDGTSSEGDGSGEGGGAGAGGGESKIPTSAQIRASLKAFRDASPEHAQAARLLNDGYSRSLAFQELFPTVDDARSVRTQLDAVGGLEGLANMQSTMASIEETDSLLENGDPSVLDRIIEDAPDGFKKLAPHYLSRLQKLDPAAFTGAVQPHFVKALTDARFPSVVNYLIQNLSDKPELQKVVQSMADWFGDQKAQAERSNQDLLNPEREKLNGEWDKINKAKRDELNTHITSQVTPHINNTLGAELKPYVNSLNALPQVVRMNVARSCMEKLADALGKDQAYQNTLKGLMGVRQPDRARIVSLNKSKVSAVAKGIVEQVAKDYGLTANAAARGAGAGAGKGQGQGQGRAADGKFTSNAIIKLGQAPKDNEIDWGFDRAKEAFIAHRAALTEEAAKRRGLKSRFVSW